MKPGKRIIFLALTIIMILCFCACKENQSTGNAKEAETQDEMAIETETPTKTTETIETTEASQESPLEETAEYNISENPYWKEGIPLISNIGKTAEEIIKDYQKLKFMDCIDGYNYFFDSENEIDYFFDYFDSNGDVTSTLSGNMVCHGFLTTLEKLFPSLSANYGNEPLSIGTLEQCLGVSFEKMYPDDKEDNSFFAILPSENLAVIIYTEEFSRLPPNYGISVVEDN